MRRLLAAVLAFSLASSPAAPAFASSDIGPRGPAAAAPSPAISAALTPHLDLFFDRPYAESLAGLIAAARPQAGAENEPSAVAARLVLGMIVEPGRTESLRAALPEHAAALTRLEFIARRLPREAASIPALEGLLDVARRVADFSREDIDPARALAKLDHRFDGRESLPAPALEAPAARALAVRTTTPWSSLRPRLEPMNADPSGFGAAVDIRTPSAPPRPLATRRFPPLDFPALRRLASAARALGGRLLAAARAARWQSLPAKRFELAASIVGRSEEARAAGRMELLSEALDYVRRYVGMHPFAPEVARAARTGKLMPLAAKTGENAAGASGPETSLVPVAALDEQGVVQRDQRITLAASAALGATLALAGCSLWSAAAASAAYWLMGDFTIRRLASYRDRLHAERKPEEHFWFFIFRAGICWGLAYVVMGMPANPTPELLLPVIFKYLAAWEAFRQALVYLPDSLFVLRRYELSNDARVETLEYWRRYKIANGTRALLRSTQKALETLRDRQASLRERAWRLESALRGRGLPAPVLLKGEPLGSAVTKLLAAPSGEARAKTRLLVEEWIKLQAFEAHKTGEPEDIGALAGLARLVGTGPRFKELVLAGIADGGGRPDDQMLSDLELQLQARERLAASNEPPLLPDETVPARPRNAAPIALFDAAGFNAALGILKAEADMLEAGRKDLVVEAMALAAAYLRRHPYAPEVRAARTGPAGELRQGTFAREGDSLASERRQLEHASMEAVPNLAASHLMRVLFIERLGKRSQRVSLGLAAAAWAMGAPGFALAAAAGGLILPAAARGAARRKDRDFRQHNRLYHEAAQLYLERYEALNDTAEARRLALADYAALLKRQLKLQAAIDPLGEAFSPSLPSEAPSGLVENEAPESGLAKLLVHPHEPVRDEARTIIERLIQIDAVEAVREEDGCGRLAEHAMIWARARAAEPWDEVKAHIGTLVAAKLSEYSIEPGPVFFEELGEHLETRRKLEPLKWEPYARIDAATTYPSPQPSPSRGEGEPE